MKLAFDLHTSDWVVIQKYFRDKKAPMWHVPVFIIGTIVLVVLNVLYLLRHEADWMTGVSVVVILCMVYLLYLRKDADKQLVKTAEKIKANNPEAFGHREMEFSDEGIRMSTANGSKSLTWAEMSSFEDAVGYLLLYSNKGVVYIVPKRALTEVEDFVEMLQNRFHPEEPAEVRNSEN